MAPPREEHDAGGPASDHEVRARMVALAQERDALALMRDALKAELAARTRELEANERRVEALERERQAALDEKARAEAELARAEKVVEEYRKLHDLTVMELERLRRHLFGRKAERVDPAQKQLIFEALRKELDAVRDPAAEERARAEEKAREGRARGGDKKRGPRQKDKLDLSLLPVERIEIPDPRVLAEPDRWVRISEQVSSKLEFRRASMVRLEIVRPVWVRRDAVAEVAREVLATADAPEEGDAAPTPTGSSAAVTAVTAVTIEGAPIGSAATRVATTGMPRVIVAPVPEHPIARCLAGPALLAHVLVSRFADHLPYNRLAKRFAREGVELADSTMCGWVEPCAKLLGRVVDAMLADAIATAPWIGIDPTGVLVQQKEKCRRGYFWVMVAARDHVFFRYTPKQNGDVPKRLLREYEGYVQADAASVYNALFDLDDKIEVGCWSHCRRRFYDARKSDEERSLTAIGFIHQLYAIDDETRKLGPSERTKERAARAGPVLEKFKAWLDKEAAVTLPRSPIGEAIAYARNQWAPLTRFVEDGRLRLDNNLSELELRSIAVGRKNWLFVGTDEYGEHAAVIVSLVASCRLHGVNPETYLRDVLLLINTWPADKVLQLAPKYWAATREGLHDDQKAILAIWPH